MIGVVFRRKICQETIWGNNTMTGERRRDMKLIVRVQGMKTEYLRPQVTHVSDLLKFSHMKLR